MSSELSGKLVPTSIAITGLEHEREALDTSHFFIKSNLSLALKLRYSFGMQERMKGVRQLLPGRSIAQKMKIAGESDSLTNLRDFDIWLEEAIVSLDPSEKELVEQQIVSWTTCYPPMASDFSGEDISIILEHRDSALIQAYVPFMPVNPVGKVALAELI